MQLGGALPTGIGQAPQQGLTVETAAGSVVQPQAAGEAFMGAEPVVAVASTEVVLPVGSMAVLAVAAEAASRTNKAARGLAIAHWWALV